MTTANKKHYSYRQQILLLAGGLLVVLSLIIAVATALVSREQVKNLLFTHGMEWSQLLAENSVVAFLYEDAEIIRESVKTLMDSGEIDHIELVTVAGDVIIQQGLQNTVTNLYPQQHTTAHEFTETQDAWFYSVAVTTGSKVSAASIQEESDFIDTELLNEQQEMLLGYVHITLSKRSLTQAEQQIFFSNLVIAILLSSILVIILLFLTRKLFKPLENLAGVMGKTSRGLWQTSDNPSAPSEIRSISQAYNEMIQALKHRDEELQKREQDLAVTLNSIGDAVIATDAEGFMTHMNPVAERLTGWSFKEAQGQPLKDIFSIINASTREPIPNPVDNVIATGETIYLSNHTTLIARDGAEYQIADSAAPIRNEGGAILGMVLVFNDVTGQYRLREQAKSVQQQLQGLLDDMQTMVGILECDGTLIFVNNTPLKAAGIEKEDVLGKKLWDCYWFTHDSKLQDSVQDDIARAKAGENILRDIQVTMAEGLLWIEFSVHPVFNAEGQIIQLVAEGRDVSKRLQQEEQLRRSQKMDALGKLTGGVAHDYNNMLNIVLGYAEILESELSNQPELAECAHEIKHAGKRGAKLTKKLLSFSRHKSADADMLDINTQLRDEQLMLEKTLTARIQLSLELADNLWPVWVDGGEMEDCVINLCINAMHAIEGSGQLTMRTYNERVSPLDAELLDLEAGEYVAFSLTDTGCGMDKSTRERIFEPFYSTKGDLGTGLGLSQVYGFVTSSGGAIKVYSEPGQGTKFVLYFPRFLEQDDMDESADDQPAIDLDGTETILVVDDEHALLDLTCRMLDQRGYHVLRAESGEQALEILKTESIDLLLSDVIMPDMDGYQLAASVQAQYPSIKIQLASGFADNRNMGMVDERLQQNLLPKPFNSQALLQTVRNLLNKK